MLGKAEMSPRNKLVGLLLIGGLAFCGAGFYRTIPKATNPNTVESRVRSWLGSFRLNVQDAPSEDAYFRIIVSKENGNKITVARLKERDRYIVLQGTIAPSEQDRAVLGKLSHDEAEQLRDELVAEMARARISHTGILLPFGNVTLEKRIPITDELTEDVLIGQIDDLDSTLVLFRDITIMALRRNKLIP
jgi:hypothetical protein